MLIGKPHTTEAMLKTVSNEKYLPFKVSVPLQLQCLDTYHTDTRTTQQHRDRKHPSHDHTRPWKRHKNTHTHSLTTRRTPIKPIIPPRKRHEVTTTSPHYQTRRRQARNNENKYHIFLHPVTIILFSYIFIPGTFARGWRREEQLPKTPRKLCTRPHGRSAD